MADVLGPKAEEALSLAGETGLDIVCSLDGMQARCQYRGLNRYAVRLMVLGGRVQGSAEGSESARVAA